MKDKERKMLKMLKRHSENYDAKKGISLTNDFLQMSFILEDLQKLDDKKAFHAMYALIEQHLNDQVVINERGSRISKLQKGQTQPKSTGHKNLAGLKKEFKANLSKKDKDTI